MIFFTLTPVRAALALALGATLLPAAHATNGYFPHGFGIKAKGMGGASIATANDAFAGVNNPASAMFAGSRMEVGGDLFMPDREMSRTGSPFPGGMMNTAETSGRTAFLIPEFGYNAVLSDKLAVGLSVYGNGGMNTSYPGGSTTCMGPGGAVPGNNPLCGQGKLGVDLMQLIVAPTVAYQLAPNHSVGVSPLMVYQTFRADGLQAFQAMPGASSAPASLTNNGKDHSTGIGVRLGYMGKLTDKVSVGAAYSPEISMSRFDKYAGLFAEQGKFNIPANYGVGAAFQVTPSVQLAVDYTRINYSKVPSIGNPAGFNMGAANGGGFGWRDVETLKLGMQWKMNDKTTLRFGVNRGTNPVTGANITPNILAPGVMQTHFTMGGTYALTPKSELSWSLAYAPRVTVTGPSLFNGAMPPGTNLQESVSMKQTSIGIQYGWKF